MSDSEPNPYASPKTSTAVDKPDAFRNAPLFTIVSVTLLIFVVALATIVVLTRGQLGSDTLLAVIAQSLVMGPGIAVALILFFPVYISPTGIRCYNFWGLYGSVRWEDVTWARPANLVGFRYIRVGSPDRNTPLWVPLFLAKKRKFVARVREIAGEENPVSQVLDGAS